ncbi:MAG: YfiR family protein [Flammeovirgaceae bacterium]|nr:YfiR family protein [Flammeovirgaceae bacterium]
MRKLLCLASLLIPLVSSGQSYKGHTLYIFSFTKYIQWPESNNQGDFEIAVLGDSPILDELKIMAAAKKAGNRVIKVNKINSLSELKKCNILFIPAGNSAQLSDAMIKGQALSVLVVTESEGLGAKGSCINFIMKDGKLSFELNQAAMAKQNLKASNELTRYAILI